MSRLDEIAAELAEKLEKATPGPWEARPPDDGPYGCTVRHVLGAVGAHRCGDGRPMVFLDILDEEPWPGVDNAAAIVSLRNAAPLLLRERAALVAVEEAARAVAHGQYPSLVAALAALTRLRAEAEEQKGAKHGDAALADLERERASKEEIKAGLVDAMDRLSSLKSAAEEVGGLRGRLKALTDSLRDDGRAAAEACGCRWVDHTQGFCNCGKIADLIDSALKEPMPEKKKPKPVVGWTPAAHHPALVAAVEALEKVIVDYGECGQAPEYGILPCRCAYCQATAALALLRAAMEKAETMYVEGEENDPERHVYRCKRNMPRRHDDEVRYRVTVLRWEE